MFLNESSEGARASKFKDIVKVVDNDIVRKAKYPIDGFLDYVNGTFTPSQKKTFKEVVDFYKGFNPSFNPNELRGIDFDLPISNVIKHKDNVMYQMVNYRQNYR